MRMEPAQKLVIIKNYASASSESEVIVTRSFARKQILAFLWFPRTTSRIGPDWWNLFAICVDTESSMRISTRLLIVSCAIGLVLQLRVDLPVEQANRFEW